MMMHRAGWTLYLVEKSSRMILTEIGHMSCFVKDIESKSVHSDVPTVGSDVAEWLEEQEIPYTTKWFLVENLDTWCFCYPMITFQRDTDRVAFQLRY